MEFKFKNIYIGKLIEALVSEKKLNEERICRFLKINGIQLDAMYKTKSMDTELLLRWSKLLEYDLFRVYSQHLLLYAPPANMNYNRTSATKNNKIPGFTKSLYTPEIVEFIIGQIERKEKTPAEIIVQYRIPKTTLYKWIKKHKKTEE